MKKFHKEECPIAFVRSDAEDIVGQLVRFMPPRRAQQKAATHTANAPEI